MSSWRCTKLRAWPYIGNREVAWRSLPMTKVSFGDEGKLGDRNHCQKKRFGSVQLWSHDIGCL